jgi:glycosyltransferase involved in cell wall biosynthesis
MYALYRFLKKHSNEYDIVLANYNRTAWPVWLGSNSTNYYYIQAYEVEFSLARNIKAFLERMTAWLTYFLPLHKVVNAKIYKKYKNIKCEQVIPPGLDLNIYYPKKLLKNHNKEFVVGCIGRKAEWKGSNDVGEAVKILRSKGYKVKFKVAFEPIRYTEYELVKPDGDENLAELYRSPDVLIAPGHIQLGGWCTLSCYWDSGMQSSCYNYTGY